MVLLLIDGQVASTDKHMIGQADSFRTTLFECILFNEFTFEHGWDNYYLLHSLLEEGEFSCFTDDQIGPLYNHNGDKESCVTGVFKLLSLGIGLK